MSARRYGTKRYAMTVLITLLRAWAKARRNYYTKLSLTFHSSVQVAMARESEREAFGAVMGAVRALRGTGASFERLEAYFDRRFLQINHGKVTRRPFAELREAA